MANWCSNTVAFKGNKKAIGKIQKLFLSMTEKEQTEEKGQLPDFITLDNCYFFDIYQNEGVKGVFQYQTKWQPNLEIVQKIAEYYKVDFVQDYEEMGNLIYGQAIHHNEILQDIYLEDEDFKQYEYDEEDDCYHFEDKEYDNDSEILEILLERKIKNQQP